MCIRDRINGILLDTCETEKETVECLIITDATDMNDSGVAMGKLGGMIITSDTGGFFGTEWDDQPIRCLLYTSLNDLAYHCYRWDRSLCLSEYSSTCNTVHSLWHR